MTDRKTKKSPLYGQAVNPDIVDSGAEQAPGKAAASFLFARVTV